MRTRAVKLLTRAGLIGAVGLAYALFCARTGLALPCPFHALTGLWCPGCGASRMCLALLRGDVSAAWGYNPALMSLLPVLAAVLARMGFRYVRAGEARPARGESVLIWAMALALLVFGALRNLPGFATLSPG